MDYGGAGAGCYWTHSPAWGGAGKASQMTLGVMFKLLLKRERLSWRCLALKVQDHLNVAKDIKISGVPSLCLGIQTNFSNKNKIVVRVCHSKLSVNQLKAFFFFLLMDAACICGKRTCLCPNGTFTAFALSFLMETLICLCHGFFFFLKVIEL